MTAETSNARGELRMADIREDAREPLQLLREKLVHDEDGWAALCQLMPMIAAAPPPAAAQQQVQAAADDMGGFSSDTAALAFLSIIGNGNPNVERAVERLRQSLIAQQPAAPSGEDRGFDANFLRSVANACRAAYDLCQPKPQRTPEDAREHYGELCLLELTSIADEIERRLAAADATQPGGSDNDR